VVDRGGPGNPDPLPLLRRFFKFPIQIVPSKWLDPSIFEENSAGPLPPFLIPRSAPGL
jgi:hypothetical protein